MGNIRIDFKKDYEEYLHKYVPENIKNKLPTPIGNDKVIFRLEMAIDKNNRNKFDGVKRQIIYSQQALEKIKILKDKSSEKYIEIINCLENGDRKLNEKQRKILNKASYEFLNMKEDIEQQTYYDRLLLLLNINHYHLLEKGKRNTLLYLTFKGNKVYIFDIGPHNLIYNYEHFVEIMEVEEWDEVLPLYKLNGLNKDLSDIEYKKQVRKSNISTSIQGKKNIYTSKNSISTAGVPLELVRYNYYRNFRLKDFENSIKNSIQVSPFSSIKIKALWKYSDIENNFYFKEEVTNQYFILVLEKDNFIKGQKNMRIYNLEDYFLKTIIKLTKHKIYNL
jgi:predicted transcriptional regulator with HTH domain